VRAADVVVIVTGHRNVDYKMVLQNAKRVVDTTSVTAGLQHSGKVMRLGAPTPRRAADVGGNGAE